MVTIKKLLDDWKYVLSRYTDITFLHSCTFLLFIFANTLANTVPNERRRPLPFLQCRLHIMIKVYSYLKIN